MVGVLPGHLAGERTVLASLGGEGQDPVGQGRPARDRRRRLARAVAAQVNVPSSWIARAIFASLAGVAVQFPASFPSTAGAAAGAASAGGGWVPPEGWKLRR